MKKEELNADELTAIIALRNLTTHASYDDEDKIISSEHQDYDDESVTSSGISSNEVFLESNNNDAEFYIKKTIKKIRSVCSDALINLLDPQLDDIIRSVCRTSIESASTNLKYIMAETNLLFLNDSIEKELIFKVEVLIKAVAVYYLSLQSLHIYEEIESVEELLTEYSSYNIFSDCSSDDAEEGRYLLNFRNYMKKALRIIPAKRNKMLLVHICAILEGSKRSYVKGGTQSSATTRRTIIYEHESGHHKICRPRPEGHRRAKATMSPLLISKPEVVKCSCGALVPEKSMGMHVQKNKHKRLLASLAAKPMPLVPPPPPPTTTAMRADYVNLPPQATAPLAPLPHLPPLIPLSRPHGQYSTFPPMYRAEYVSSSMMPQPSMYTVHCGLPVSMSMPMPMPMFSPIQWVYQTSQPQPSFYTSSSSSSTSIQYVQLDSPPAMPSGGHPQWSLPHWQR